MEQRLPDALRSQRGQGAQRFHQSLMGLVKQNLVSYEEAKRQATNPEDFALRIPGISATSDATGDLRAATFWRRACGWAQLVRRDPR